MKTAISLKLTHTEANTLRRLLLNQLEAQHKRPNASPRLLENDLLTLSMKMTLDVRRYQQ